MNGDCEYTVDGTDTDGTVWYRCTTHDELAPSDEAPCAGYIEVAYIEAEQRRARPDEWPALLAERHDIPECSDHEHGPQACACGCHEDQRAKETA